jgi:lipopolysaccharide transport system ATP-binding protein
MSWSIRIENLSKAYRLGGVPVVSNNLREDLVRTIRSVFSHKNASSLPEQKPNADGLPPGHFWALRDINLTLNQGDVVGLIGFNGSGKSTLLKLLSRITEPTEGRFDYRGRLGSLLEVGTGFHRELSGRENIFLNGSILGMKRHEIKKVFDEIVAFSEIEKFLDTPVKFYSSGMYVRLAFSVAAHLETDILLVDEVLAVGDLRFQEKCMGKMQHVANQGRTVIFVSHNMGAVDRLCKSGIMLRSGQVICHGTQREAIQHYLVAGHDYAYNLDLHPNREGEGGFRVRSIQLTDASGAVLEHAAGGESVELRFHYEVEAGLEIRDLDFGIKVVTQENQPVFFHYHLLDGMQFDRISGKGTLICRIPKLPLPAGSFQINYHAAMDLGRTGRFYDKVVNAFELKVVDGSFYPSGRTPDLGRCVALLDAQWRLS